MKISFCEVRVFCLTVTFAKTKFARLLNWHDQLLNKVSLSRKNLSIYVVHTSKYCQGKLGRLCGALGP